MAYHIHDMDLGTRGKVVLVKHTRLLVVELLDAAVKASAAPGVVDASLKLRNRIWHCRAEVHMSGILGLPKRPQLPCHVVALGVERKQHIVVQINLAHAGPGRVMTRGLGVVVDERHDDSGVPGLVHDVLLR
jgi:hypothetical protein